MADIARKTKRYPTDLTDEEWVRTEPFMPKPPKRGRKISVDLREMLNAIRYMARSGGGWRMLPTNFGPRSWRQRASRDHQMHIPHRARRHRWSVLLKR